MLARLERWLSRPRAPVVFAVLTGAVFWWLAGSLSPVPWVYDEAAYLLQAKIFATGHWTAPGRPLPEFFEQLHVFVTPRLVPKYPPGHALLLVPGVWVGAPWLMPLLFTATTGGLVFLFGRSLLGAWPATIGWLVWVTSPEELYLRPSYMSQVTSTLVWLVAWWALERWRVHRKTADLVVVVALGAVGVLIRPITALAFLLPIGVVVLAAAWRQRRWTSVGIAAAMALPVLGIAARWSEASSGRIFPTPYSEYSRVYTPWNMPGFTVDTTPPERAEIPAIRRFRTEWLPLHQRHTVSRLPAIAADRLRGLGITFFGDGGFPGVRPPLRWLMLVPFAVGLFGLHRAIRLGLVSAVTLFVAMLWLASRPLWTVYYLEVFPVLAAITAAGAWRVARWSSDRLRIVSAAGVVVAGIVVAVPGTVDRLLRSKEQQTDLRFVATELARQVALIPGRLIVFIAPGPVHRPHESYVVNEPDLDAARVWLVHDRGEDNARLLALAPERLPYRFDPASGHLEPLGRP